MMAINKLKTNCHNYRIVILLFCISSLACAQEKNKVISLGDKSPPIQGLKWLKGEAVSSFESGRVYVVEFGYIGCPGCTQSIPHMSEIVQRYNGQVTLISVFYNEKLSRMPRFLSSWGDRIQYTVAIDDENTQFMRNTWLKPAGINYAPVAFIIDQKGTIVWIGNPGKGFGLDEAIEATIRGEDLKQVRMNAYINKSFINAANQAKEQGDIETALLILERAIRENPDSQQPYVLKLEFLLMMNEGEGYKFARDLLDGRFANDAIALNRFISAKIFRFYEDKMISNPDWDLVIALNKRAVEVNLYPIDAFSMHKSIADAYAFKGDYEKAIQILETAINELKNSGYNKEETDGWDVYLTNSIRLIKEMKGGKT